MNIYIIKPTAHTKIWVSNKIIKTIALNIWTYSKKNNNDVKHICALRITKPKSKSHKNKTKYQLVHIKQLKNNHAKHTPHIICIHIKKPKLKPTPYTLNKQPDVKSLFFFLRFSILYIN